MGFGHDSLSCETWRQQIRKEQYAAAAPVNPPPGGLYRLTDPPPASPRGGASSITLHLRADSAAGRPIEPVKAEPALPHMQHHFGYGWFDDSARSWTRASSARGTPSTVWEGNGRKHAPELHASPHPYLLPSQRLPQYPLSSLPL